MVAITNGEWVTQDRKSRCVELERHSLLLWGLVGGGLCAFTNLAINPDRFPDNAQRAIALFVWLGVWLGGMSWLDHRLTRQARQARAETPTPTTATLNVPAGTIVPMYIDMDSALATISPEASVPVRVTRNTEIALTDGQPKLDAGKPEIRMHGDFIFKGEQP